MQIAGNLPEHVQIRMMFSSARRGIGLGKIETRPQRMLTLTWRGDISLGTQHGAQCGALFVRRQGGDLPANPLEWQPGALTEPLGIGSAGQNHDRRLGQQLIAGQRLPLLAASTQFERVPMAMQLDRRVLDQPATQRWWVRPAGIRIEQPPMVQHYARQPLGLFARHRMQKTGREGVGKCRLADAFLMIEGELQHAAGIPVLSALQVVQ